MIFGYKFLEYFIFAEIIIVLLLVVLTLIMKAVYRWRQRRKSNFSERARNLIDDRLAKNQSIEKNDFSKGSQKMDVLQPLLAEEREHPGWPEIQERLTKEVLLPQARRATTARKWTKRCWAVKCFELHVDKEDQDYIIQLLNDKIPLIQFHAVWPAVEIGTEKTINSVIERAAEERRLAQSIFLEVFEQHEQFDCEYVVKRLTYEEDPYIRTMCYKILMVEKNSEALKIAIEDSNKDNIELRLSAMRYMGLSRTPQVVDHLGKLLKNHQPEVRLTAANILGNLKADRMLSDVAELLHDEKWWVRLDAARALMKFGFQGIDLLKSVPETDEVYELCQQVLSSREENYA